MEVLKVKGKMFGKIEKKEGRRSAKG